ncbi:PDR/VanB family oxidoreductase [Methylobacterium sp. ID0610]|uniref:PDR/VanB family oxidoreductase n=1 Tax=Methylobacterium carpenticola TaxID=3344827 RepID=UPI003674CC3D
MAPRLIMKLQVAAAEPTTPEVLHLVLVHPQRPALPAWEAGAHIDLRLPDGRVRQYSLCGDPADRSRYEIAIKREEAGRGGSLWAHGHLGPGALAHVSAPRNAFPLAAGARRHILVAGGIGATPILAMTRTLAAEGADFAVHLCARSADTAPLLGALRAACGERLLLYLSAEGRRFDPAGLPEPEPGTHLYVCGPPGLIAAVEAATAAKGWPPAQRHLERFAPESDETFVPEPFDAVIASTGQVIRVPAETSLLAALRAEGFPLPSSCETGLCGSCLCGYRGGTVIHRDSVVPASERGERLAPCVSRARGRLVLSL